MERYSLDEARLYLDQLITQAREGKTVLIVDENEGAVQLVPVSSPPLRPRRAGSARGLIKMADDFDAPLEDFDDYMA
jgi:antitoxin (DNA-binding transcriptional repressor) of toxin-antitoxin stability system